MGNVRFWKLGGEGEGSDVSSGSVWGPSLAIPSLKMDCSQLGHDGLFFRLVILSWRVGTPSRFLYLSGLICSTFVQLYSFRIMCDTLCQPSDEIINRRNPLLQCVHVFCFGFRCACVLGRGISRLLFLGLLRVVARVLRAGLSEGFSRCLFGVSYVVGFFRPFVTAISVHDYGYNRRLLFAVLRSHFLLRRWLPLLRRSTRKLLLSRLKVDERRETVVLTGTMFTFREELSEPYLIMGSAWEKIRFWLPSLPLLRDYTPDIFNEAPLGFLYGQSAHLRWFLRCCSLRFFSLGLY